MEEREPDGIMLAKKLIPTKFYISDQIRSVAQSCPTLCDPMLENNPEPSLQNEEEARHP